MNDNAELDLNADESDALDRTRLATISLHISAVLYIVAGALLAMVPFAWDPATTVEYALRSNVSWFLATLSFGLALLAHVLIRALRQRKRWAWMTAAVLFSLYLPSAFLPLGAVGLFGLMSKGTRARFPAARSARVRRKR